MQPIQAINTSDAILIAVCTGKLDDSEFHLDGTRGGALFSVIIVHDQAGVNDSWNPAEQSQNDAEKETSNATGQKHRERRQHHAKEISQRFHHELFFFSFLFLFSWSPDSAVCSA